MGLHAQVTLAHQSLMPRDAVINTFAFSGVTEDFGLGELGSVADALEDFYTQIPAGQDHSLAANMSGAISRAAGVHQIKIWEMGFGDVSPSLGDPDFTHFFTMPAIVGATKPLPQEVALVLSLEASGIGDVEEEVEAGAPGPAGNLRPKQRHRGRIYLGPWTITALADVASQEARPLTGIVSSTLAKVGELNEAVNAIDIGVNLGVWSRKDEVIRRVTAASIDNSFDVMRSRSIRATAKTRVLL